MQGHGESQPVLPLLSVQPGLAEFNVRHRLMQMTPFAYLLFGRRVGDSAGVCGLPPCDILRYTMNNP